MANAMQRQKKEFDAVEALSTHYRRLCSTPIVDDDYPQIRSGYELALADLMTAMKENDRFKPDSHYGIRYGVVERP